VLGVFNGVTGFIGIREKFNHEYLFTEYHYDTGAPYGTVHSVEDAGIELPSNIEAVENLAGGAPNVALFEWLMAKEHELLPEHRQEIEARRKRIAKEDEEDDYAAPGA
jgi:hypothetical protein